MNETLHIYEKVKDKSNHVITHLCLKDEKPIQLFGSKNNARK